MSKKRKQEQFPYVVSLLLRRIESLDKKKEEIKKMEATLFTEREEFESSIRNIVLYKAEITECLDVLRTKTKKKKESTQLDMFIHSDNKK